MHFPTHIVAAAGFVEDKNGNLLLIQSPLRGWEIPGGQIENGESIEDGVLREILEESGITTTLRCLAGVYSNIGQHLWHDGKTHVPTKVMFDFICDYVSGQPTPSNESDAVMWVPKSEVLHQITAPAMRFRVENALNFNGKINYCSYVTNPSFQILSARNI